MTKQYMREKQNKKKQNCRKIKQQKNRTVKKQDSDKIQVENYVKTYEK